jgi:hypothetical protein
VRKGEDRKDVKGTSQVLTGEEKPSCLIRPQLLAQKVAIAIQNGLTPLQQRYLQMKVLQDLDERFFQAGYLQSVFDPPDETDRVNLRTDVFKETSDERCEWVRKSSSARTTQRDYECAGGLAWPRL